MAKSRAASRSFVFYLVENFSLIAFSMAIEPLRMANRMLGSDYYSWRLSSSDGKPVVASNGVSVSVDSSMSDEKRFLSGAERPAMVLVCAGLGVERFLSKSLNGWLREEHQRGVAIGGLCTAAWILADAGLLSRRRCAIHWENLPGFSEAFPKVEVFADLFEVDDDIYTCAGGTAALDMMLAILADDHDDDLVNRVCEQALTDRVRGAQDRQRLPLRARLGIQNPKVVAVIEIMEDHLSEPLSLEEIALQVDLSRRQVERLFRHEMHKSPARYYLEVRLERARYLLKQSSLPVVEVAIACGFISASHFSKCYREHYALAPQRERQASRQLEAAY